MANKHINIQHATSLSENACPGQPAIICHEILGVTPSFHQVQVANATVGLITAEDGDRGEGRWDPSGPANPGMQAELRFEWGCDY